MVTNGIAFESYTGKGIVQAVTGKVADKKDYIGVFVEIKKSSLIGKHPYQHIPVTGRQYSAKLSLTLLEKEVHCKNDRSQCQKLLRHTILTGRHQSNRYTDSELRMNLSGLGMPEFNKS